MCIDTQDFDEIYHSSCVEHSQNVWNIHMNKSRDQVPYDTNYPNSENGMEGRSSRYGCGCQKVQDQEIQPDKNMKINTIVEAKDFSTLNAKEQLFYNTATFGFNATKL